MKVSKEAGGVLIGIIAFFVLLKLRGIMDTAETFLQLIIGITLYHYIGERIKKWLGERSEEE